MNKIGKVSAVITTVLGIAFASISFVAVKKKKDSVYGNDFSQKNPLEGKRVVFVENEDEPANADGVRGHLEAVGEVDYRERVYEKYIKRGMDIILSFCGLVMLTPVLAGIAIAIKIDDPGPILFTQKRLGKNKRYFKLHKFRSMKMCTPHDRPTHMLDNPDQYITKVGKFIRAHSLDELPQIWDIFIGNMSIVGPRPGLWNQDLLTAERDKYGVNDIKPGLTGWAQINGRDELEIPDKAKLDGEYVQNMGFTMDVKVFLKSIHVFGGDNSVIEGKTSGTQINMDISEFFPETMPIKHKNILVTGANSYIGTSFVNYLKNYRDFYSIETIDTRNDGWKKVDFSKFDVIYHVAGIAHIKETKVNKQLYYDVNRDLTIEIAKKAKNEGVSQFIIMSSMSVYGMTKGHITKSTIPNPNTAYGDSKLQADNFLNTIADDKFKVAILRPPMVYGKNCKGNYQQLRAFALKSPIFPKYKNERSMIYIGNLCEFVKRVIDIDAEGLFFPQNRDYVCTSEMVKQIANDNGKLIVEPSGFNAFISLIHLNVFEKVFGNLTYEKVDTIDKFGFEESIWLCEE